MADDFRPHLLITEDDVESFENVKQARSKDLGLDRMAHGTKLSSGLQEIVSAYTRVQGMILFEMKTSVCLRLFCKKVKSSQIKLFVSFWNRKE